MFKRIPRRRSSLGPLLGLVKQFANALSAAGARVIVADLNRRDGERVAQACAANGQSAHFFSLDVTDERNCVGVADTVRNEYGPLDILINNRGHRPRWNNRSNRRNRPGPTVRCECPWSV
jgi:NAD(P)-dependent dehydrogenase (short-subunit alcohol dehydrogenase family)